MYFLVLHVTYTLSSDLTLEQTLDVFKLMTLTYARYVDSKSREAIACVGAKIVEKDESRASKDESGPKKGVADHVIGWIRSEAVRVTGKGASGLVVLPTSSFLRKHAFTHLPEQSHPQTNSFFSIGAVLYTRHASRSIHSSPKHRIGTNWSNR